MVDLLCPYVTFIFTISQLFINLLFLVPNLLGVTTPVLSVSFGSVFGCNV